MHWQSLWEQQYGFTRVEQEDWDHPSRAAWVKRLEAALDALPEPAILVAHSLGCAVVAHAAKRAHKQIAGALLVAPADVEDEERAPEGTRTFAPLPTKPLGFAATVVASRDDPFIAFERAAHFADIWDARFVDAGAVGHINAESGLGAWPDGYRLLEDLLR
jgi:predicted alpha/beta hydrolase family esterase